MAYSKAAGTVYARYEPQYYGQEYLGWNDYVLRPDEQFVVNLPDSDLQRDSHE